MAYADALAELIEQFAALPGIGRKSAQRLAFHILKEPKEEAFALANAIVKAKKTIHYCKRCYNLTDQELCPICRNTRREQKTICVVEDAKDIVAMERIGSYFGLYHVLGGALSPLDGVGPEQLRIKELLIRLQTEDTEEVILATNPTIEGEATAMYLKSLLKPSGIKLTRLAQGLPAGSDIQYADEITLGQALNNRLEI